jgi:hypothetical protein
MYNHTRQYRCAIIRGKSQTELDNLLLLYAKTIINTCPCEEKAFKKVFDESLSNALSVKDKTLANHSTEIAGQLFGMYCVADDGFVYPSKRTLKFLEDSDTPAFFKDICYKMQFPNGSQKKDLPNHINNGICIRQYPFILKVMLLAKSNNVTLTKKEIGYYLLNSLDVLQGKANPLEVYDAIASDRKNSIERDIVTPGKNRSYDWQHITEQINLLELANLVVVNNNDEVLLNQNEANTIQLFAEKYADKPEFDVYSYDLADNKQRKQFKFDWS